jgi:hypothetical protein
VIARVIVGLLLHLGTSSGTTRTGIDAVRELDLRLFRVEISSHGSKERLSTDGHEIVVEMRANLCRQPSSDLGRCANAKLLHHVMPHIHHAHCKTP